MPDTTRFGSPTLPLEACVGVLRAKASSSGVKLLYPTPVDMLAAAVVVDACCVILGRNVLENPVSHGQSLAAVLAAALSRVSGYPGPVLEMPLEYTADSEAMLVLAEEHVDWIRTICPQAPAQVLVRAASDLSAAGFETAFASYGSLLQLLAVQSDYS